MHRKVTSQEAGFDAQALESERKKMGRWWEEERMMESDRVRVRTWKRRCTMRRGGDVAG